MGSAKSLRNLWFLHQWHLPRTAVLGSVHVLDEELVSACANHPIAHRRALSLCQYDQFDAARAHPDHTFAPIWQLLSSPCARS